MKLNNLMSMLLWVGLLAAGSAGAEQASDKLWTVQDLVSDQARPYAIGHRGSGANLGEAPDKPIENTLESVVNAFEAGLSIVEVDVTVTADGMAVALHDDFLEDYTCVNTLTYDELKARLHHVPTLTKLLNTSKKYARKAESLSGLVNIEVKTPAPMCDPLDTGEDELVNAVVEAIQKAGMQEQVIVESFSPALLGLFAQQAPELPRNLTVDAVQFLTPEQVEAITGLTVTLIDKQAGFGLQWAETGPFYRLPGYASMEEYIGVAYGTGSQFATLDKLILGQMDMATSCGLIQQLQAMGLVVTVYSAEDILEWIWLESIGTDGIYVDNVALGMAMQP